MADIKVGDLPAASFPLSGQEVLIVNQNNETKACQANALVSLVSTKTGIEDMKSDISQNKTNISGINTTISGMSQGMSGMANQILENKDNISTINTTLSSKANVSDLDLKLDKASLEFNKETGELNINAPWLE